MKSYTLMNGRIAKVDFSRVSTGKMSYTRLINPSLEDLEKVADLTKIPIDELKESKEETERPKLNIGRYLELIYSAPVTEEGDVVTVPVHIYIVNNLIVTIETQRIYVLDKLEKKIEQRKARFLFGRSPGFFLYYLLDNINDHYLAIAEKISDMLDLLQEKGTDLGNKDYEKLYSSSITSAFFNQSVLANIEVLNALKKSEYRSFESDDRHYFTELYFDALQILDTEKIQREMITNLFNLHSIITSSKINNFMKRITVLALIISIPVVISSMWGMNFAHIPFYDHPYGFWIVAASMSLITVSVLVVAKVLDWI
ncbi:hypothetical protein JW968_05035 [Candidatus Woesearchaeota archaeon]|nr:hypothetical protein [Candidatus Woesearchaeota archaeon]